MSVDLARHLGSLELMGEAEAAEEIADRASSSDRGLHVIDGEGYDPREAANNLAKGMPVCVLGCDPRAKNAERHTIRSRDELFWVRYLMQREGDCLLMIADSPLMFNVKRELGEGSEQEVARVVRLIGVREKLFVEALQDYLIEIREFHLRDAKREMALFERSYGKGERDTERAEEFRVEGSELIREWKALIFEGKTRSLTEAEMTRITSLKKEAKECMHLWHVYNNIYAKVNFERAAEHKVKSEELEEAWGKPMQRREVYLMSDVLAEEPEFMRLFQKIRVLFAADDEFKELVLECIPKGLRKRVAGDPMYALFQLAITITTLKHKIGHQGERPFDQGVSKLCERYGKQLGIDHIPRSKYEYPEVKGTSGIVFYRHMGLEQLWNMSLPNREIGSLGFFQGEDPRDGDAFFKGYMRLGEEVLIIYDNYIEGIKNCERLSLEDRNYLLEVEIWKIMDEILAEFYKIPWFKDVLERSGVLPLLRNRHCAKKGRKKNFFELPSYNNLPFHCEPRGYERNSELAYFIRYLGELFQGHLGPAGMCPNSNANWYGLRMWEFWDRLYFDLTGHTFGGLALGPPEGVLWGSLKWSKEYPEWYRETYDGLETWDYNPALMDD